VCEWAMRVLAQLTFDGDTVFGQRHTEFVCAKRGSGKTLLFKMTLAMLGQYAGVINYSELTSHMHSGSTDHNSFAMHIAFKRLIVADEGDENVGTQRARPVCWTRLKAIQGNAPKKARLAGKNQYKTVETGFVGLIAVLCNPSNMTEQPTDEMVPTLSLLNDECLAQFGDVDDPDNYRFLKDETFLRDSVIQSNRLHMLTLLSEYYDPAFNVMNDMPVMLKDIRENWHTGSPTAVEEAGDEYVEEVVTASGSQTETTLNDALVNAVRNLIVADEGGVVKRAEFMESLVKQNPKLWTRMTGDGKFNPRSIPYEVWNKVREASDAAGMNLYWKIKKKSGVMCYSGGVRVKGWHLFGFRLVM